MGLSVVWWIPPFFIYHSSRGMLLLLLYIDDILLICFNPVLLHEFTCTVSTQFAMKDLGPLHYFLGIQVHRTFDGLILSQTKYALDILERAQM